MVGNSNYLLNMKMNSTMNKNFVNKTFKKSLRNFDFNDNIGANVNNNMKSNFNFNENSANGTVKSNVSGLIRLKDIQNFMPDDLLHNAVLNELMSKTPKHEDKFLEVSNEILNALSKVKCGLSINYGEIFDFYEVENDRSYLNDHSCLSESQSLGEIESLCKSNIENEKKKTKKEEIRKLEEELDNTLGIFPHSIYVNKSTSEDPLLQRHNSGDNEGISEDSLPEYIGWNNYNPTQLRVADYVDPSLDTVIQPGDSSESSDLITLTENSESSLEFEETLTESSESSLEFEETLTESSESSLEFEETLTESSESFLKPEETPKNEYRTDYSHLWVRCEFCEIINYKEDCKKRLFICEFCEAQLKIDSSDRIELLIDPGTWCPMGGDMVSVDPIQWDRVEFLNIHKIHRLVQFEINSSIKGAVVYDEDHVDSAGVDDGDIVVHRDVVHGVDQAYNRYDVAAFCVFDRLDGEVDTATGGNWINDSRDWEGLYPSHPVDDKVGKVDDDREELLKAFPSARNSILEEIEEMGLDHEASFDDDFDEQDEETTVHQKSPFNEVPEVDRLDDPLDQVDDPMDQVDDPMDQVDDPMDQVDDPMDQVDDPLDQVDDPLDQLDDPMDKVDDLLNKVYEKDPEGEEYGHSLAYYQEETGLPDAIKTGVGQLNGIPLALGVMDFRFIAGSMGCAVGETITSLIEYATIHSLPLIIVCASGGARVQEGILSLMQMAKIAHALYNRHQSNPNLFYISLLASATTGGVLASFGMLGNIVISEPDAEIAFAGKRVIEAVLKEEVPEDVQVSEFLFENGAFELLLPRPLLKSSLSELLKFHGFLPLNSNSIK